MANSNKKLKKEALEYSAFITDIYAVMEKHKVENLLAVFGMNGQIRNLYLFTKEEHQLYSFLSDGTNAWLKQRTQI